MGKLSMPEAGGVRRPHLLDITMFWSPRGGGVARYLRSKRDWLGAHSNWRHTIMTPGASTPETIGIAAMPLPFSGGYRFPCGATQPLARSCANSRT